MIFVIITYSLMILIFSFGLLKAKRSVIDLNLTQTKFSIIIPFRNEAHNLNNLLESISQLDYDTSNFEVLLINDESSDNFKKVLKPWVNSEIQIKLFDNKRSSISPKKDAIKTALQHANYHWIVTTDADCIVPVNWLQLFNTEIKTRDVKLICGGLKLNASNTLKHQYQLIENIALQGINLGTFTLKRPMMCNAANIAFDKQVKLDIYDHPKTTSGDDIFLLEHFIKNAPDQISYLHNPEALVTTQAEKSWKEMIQQRIRWAGKSIEYKNHLTQFVGFVTLFTQLVLVFGWLISYQVTLYTWVLKFVSDSILVFIASNKTKQKINLFHYLTSSIIYPFLNTYIGIRSLTGNYTWKERRFKR